MSQMIGTQSVVQVLRSLGFERTKGGRPGHQSWTNENGATVRAHVLATKEIALATVYRIGQALETKGVIKRKDFMDQVRNRIQRGGNGAASPDDMAGYGYDPLVGEDKPMEMKVKFGKETVVVFIDSDVYVAASKYKWFVPTRKNKPGVPGGAPRTNIDGSTVSLANFAMGDYDSRYERINRTAWGGFDYRRDNLKQTTPRGARRGTPRPIPAPDPMPDPLPPTPSPTTAEASDTPPESNEPLRASIRRVEGWVVSIGGKTKGKIHETRQEAKLALAEILMEDKS